MTIKRPKKKTVPYIGKEIYGIKPREEAFKHALAPYFNKGKAFEDKNFGKAEC